MNCASRLKRQFDIHGKTTFGLAGEFQLSPIADYGNGHKRNALLPIQNGDPNQVDKTLAIETVEDSCRSQSTTDKRIISRHNC
jgi:hypothetical protein